MKPFSMVRTNLAAICAISQWYHSFLWETKNSRQSFLTSWKSATLHPHSKCAIERKRWKLARLASTRLNLLLRSFGGVRNAFVHRILEQQTACDDKSLWLNWCQFVRYISVPLVNLSELVEMSKNGLLASSELCVRITSGQVKQNSGSEQSVQLVILP